MSSEITLEQIRKAVVQLRANSLPPRVVKSLSEANALNEYERVIGLPGNWNVGDEFYFIEELG